MTPQELKNALTRYAEPQHARLFTQLDRDPDSPTFGCFDRDYWHYKIRDFSSLILQQGSLVLDELTTDARLKDPVRNRLEKWRDGSLTFTNTTLASGRIDEYYPFEDSYPASAFALYATTGILYRSILRGKRIQVPQAGIRNLAHRLVRRTETEASNQQAASLAGLLYAKELGMLTPDEGEATSKKLAAFLQTQDGEGWFPEYDGPDFGYLSVTLDALWDCYSLTKSPAVEEALTRAVKFLCHLVGADGTLPNSLNSRNTDYVVPYGLCRLAERDANAAWLFEKLFSTLNSPDHFLHATDDRYLCHYIFSSVVRSLPHLGKMKKGEPPERKAFVSLSSAGYQIFHSRDAHWTAFVCGRRGGTLRIHRKDSSPICDYGVRLIDGGKVQTSDWWRLDWEIEVSPSESEVGIQIRGGLHSTGFWVSSPLKAILLRLVARVLGRRLIPWLKSKLIFQRSSVKRDFIRSVRIRELGVSVSDEVQSKEMPRASPFYNLRHVASAQRFLPEERDADRLEYETAPTSSGGWNRKAEWKA